MSRVFCWVAAWSICSRLFCENARRVIVSEVCSASIDVTPDDFEVFLRVPCSCSSTKNVQLWGAVMSSLPLFRVTACTRQSHDRTKRLASVFLVSFALSAPRPCLPHPAQLLDVRADEPPARLPGRAVDPADEQHDCNQDRGYHQHSPVAQPDQVLERPAHHRRVPWNHR